MLKASRNVMLVALLPVLALLAFGFQNCAKANFDFSQDSILNEKYSNFSLLPMTIQTEMNQPKDFQVSFTGNKGSLSISVLDNTFATSGRTSNGTIEVINGAEFQVRYTPDPFFRGEDQVMLYAVDGYGVGGIEPALITFQVGNHLNFLKPALAIRGSSCTACHAQVQSNFVTDLGFGSYYLETGRGNVSDPDYGFYTDHGASASNPGTFSTMKLAATSQVIVPKADLVGYLRNLTNQTTLANYFRLQLGRSVTESTRQAANNVREVRSLYIGAPSARKIIQGFGFSAFQPGNLKYIANESRNPVALSGIELSGSVFRNSSNVINCDGDLLLEGRVHLNGVTIRSRNGCRIYTTSTVFISNGIQSASLDGSNNHNIQIVSAKAVSLGLGNLRSNGNFCETDSEAWYRSRLNSGVNDHYTNSSIQTHWNLHQETSYTRAFGAGDGAKSFLDNLIADSASLNLLDATCEAGGRGKAISRLLINAPRVDSRYNGNFSGSVIAEVATLSVGSFKFTFDPVFERTAILPLLRDSDFLRVEE